MTFLFGLFSFVACGDKPVTETTEPASEPSSIPSDDPIIEEELEPLEPAAIGFEYFGTWDQDSGTLGGWVFDSGEATDGYLQVHITNIEYFSEGAGTDNENICTMYASFINQPAVLDAQEYPWDNPPSNASQYPLNGTPGATWNSFDGYLSFLGFAQDTMDSCARLDDARVFTVSDDGTANITLEGMHFGMSFGPLTAGHLARLEEAYADNMDWFDANKQAFVTQYIHINHVGANGDDYDFTGYDWNYSVLAKMNADQTITTVPCEDDPTSDCYDFVDDSYDASLNVFAITNAWWYEDFPNIDFDILHLGVPEVSTAAEEFCSLFADTCGDWEGGVSCEVWYNAADMGNPADTSGASQACYDYHLGAAAADTSADPANGSYSVHCEHAAGVSVCVEGSTEPTAAEAFCSLFTDTCGAWEGSATCEDWYNAADAGNEGDTSGATQGCYDYHLSVAAGDSAADPANGVYSTHCEHAAGAAPCSAPEPTAAEAFCSLFTDTCGAWEGSATCEDWYNAADAGNEGDTSGATQGCYDYHLSVAAGDTTADPANGTYSAHCDHAAGAAPCQ